MKKVFTLQDLGVVGANPYMIII